MPHRFPLPPLRDSRRRRRHSLLTYISRLFFVPVRRTQEEKRGGGWRTPRTTKRGCLKEWWDRRGRKRRGKMLSAAKASVLCQTSLDRRRRLPNPFLFPLSFPPYCAGLCVGEKKRGRRQGEIILEAHNGDFSPIISPSPFWGAENAQKMAPIQAKSWGMRGRRRCFSRKRDGAPIFLICPRCFPR